MTRYGRFSRGTSRLSWALATVLALLLIPGMHWAQAQEDEEPQDGRAH